MENPTTKPQKFLELLETFRLGLELGVVEPQEITRWADHIIERDAEPDIFFIELSLAARKNDLVSLLHKILENKIPRVVATRAVLGLLFQHLQTGKISLKKAASLMYRLYWKADLSDYEMQFLYGFEDAHSLAADGIYGDVAEVEARVIGFLEIYKGFRLDNFEDWAQVNAEVYPQVRALQELSEPPSPSQVSTTEQKPWWKFW